MERLEGRLEVVAESVQNVKGVSSLWTCALKVVSYEYDSDCHRKLHAVPAPTTSRPLYKLLGAFPIDGQVDLSRDRVAFLATRLAGTQSRAGTAYARGQRPDVEEKVWAGRFWVTEWTEVPRRSRKLCRSRTRRRMDRAGKHVRRYNGGRSPSVLYGRSSSL